MTFGLSADAYMVTQGATFSGNFAIGDRLLCNSMHSWPLENGPDTLAFARPISAIAFQIQSNSYGAFSSRITAYGGAVLLGSFSVNGTSNGAADGSAVLLGLQDTDAEITRVIIDGLTAEGGRPQDFVINRLSLSDGAVPEPASLPLVAGGALLAAAAAGRRVRGH